MNLPWVFGNAEYLYSRYDTAYNPTRLSNLLTTSDFLEIKQAGFDHVRIPIDIECFDLNADGSVPTQAPIGSPMASLLETIDEAINCDPSGEGLAVILAFHPGTLNQTHYTNSFTINGVPPTYFPSLYKLPFVTSTPPTGPVSDTHPLVNFWMTFTPYIAHLDKSKVYLSLLDEPLISYESGNLGPDNVLESDKLLHRINWRNIQLKVIQKLRSHTDSRIRDFWLMATTYTGQPGDIDGWAGHAGALPSDQPSPDIKPFMPTGSQVKGYTATEVPGHKIIYSFSFYYPFRYTSWDYAKFEAPNSQYFPDTEYWKTRDFFGNDLPAKTPSFPPDSFPTPLSMPYGWYPWDRRQDKMFENLSAFQLIQDTPPPRPLTRFVPIYIAGFGVYMRKDGEGPQGPPDFGVIRGAGKFDDPFRLDWHYETRKAAEAKGFGWAVWELFGGYNTWTGKLSGTTINEHGAWGDIHPGMQNALFGNTDPMP